MHDLLNDIGSGKEIQNKAGISKKGIELLIEDFKDLDLLKKNYTKRILFYLLDGKRRRILSDLEMLEIFFKADHFAPRLCSAENRAELFEKRNEEGEKFLKRLGKVYHALMNPLNPNFLMPRRFKSPSWLEALLLFSSSEYSGDLRTYLQLKIIEQILVAAEKGIDNMVRHIFITDPKDYTHLDIVKTFFSLTGFSQTIPGHKDLVIEALHHQSRTIRCHALRNIAALKLPADIFMEDILACALSSPKKTRTTAIRILKHDPERAAASIKDAIEKRKTGHRIRLLELYKEFGGPGDGEWLSGLLKSEKDEKTKKIIAAIIDNK
ncbi:MAG: hypothetical protein JW881_13385 [Spirochaetales bacterium]|nr:hypothetical protein [Spirochaetales bacterium]